MTSSNYAYKTLDDIVFEGRNREYGAYLLRQVYTRNLWRGLVTALALFLLLLCIPLVVAKLRPEKPAVLPVLPKPSELIFVEVVIPDKVIPPPAAVEIEKPVAQKQEAATRKFTDFTIKPNVAHPTDIPNQDELGKTNVGTTDKAGDSAVKPPIAEVTPGVGSGTAPQPVLFSADKMPEYPGGMEAMKKFLGSNIVYPSRARQMGLEGTVLVSFVVNQNGDISGIEVLRSPGMGIQEEAIRVLKSMPKWSPGMNNGVPVSVRFTLPITFAIR